MQVDLLICMACYTLLLINKIIVGNISTKINDGVVNNIVDVFYWQQQKISE